MRSLNISCKETRMAPRKMAFAGLLLAMSAGCSTPNAEPAWAAGPKAKAEELTPSVMVKVAPVKAGPFTETITVQGRTVADADLTYSAEVPGTVESLRLSLGQRVRRGQVLARINYLSLKARVADARARSSLQQKTWRRLTVLGKDDMVPREKVDQAEAAHISADAALKIALAELSKSTIRARRGGVVTRKFVESGEYVSPGAPVLQVVDLDEVVVQGQLPESQVAAVGKGSPVKIEIRALGRTFPAKVHAVLPVASPVSRTFKFRIKVRNPSHQILIGMAATIHISVQTHEAVVLVPQDVVLEEGASRTVYVVGPGDKAVRRPVALGPTDAENVMLRSGLKPGERLVVLGQRDLKPGQPVQVVN